MKRLAIVITVISILIGVVMVIPTQKSVISGDSMDVDRLSGREATDFTTTTSITVTKSETIRSVLPTNATELGTSSSVMSTRNPIPNNNIPPADRAIRPKLNRSGIRIASSNVAPPSPHNTVMLTSGTRKLKGPLEKTQGVEPTIARKQCSPRKNIVFLKMHKCSSSTVQNILFRYGDRNDSNFVIPPASHYLGRSSFRRRFMMQLPTDEYNIFCHHTRFSETGIAEVMPKDSVYVTILREPVSMFESTFTYIKYDSVYNLSGPNPLKQFLDNPRKYYDVHDKKNHAKNPILFDLGLDNNQKDDQYYIEKMIGLLDQRFDLVMVTEFFHESLILLKDLMCWTSDDMVYFTLNARSKSSVLNDITSVMADTIKQWNLGDVKLYDHFNQTFWRKVRNFGEERMRREVQELKDANESLFKTCIDKVSDNDSRVWHPPGVKVESLQVKPSARNNTQCMNMARTELPYTELLRKNMKSKYHIR